MTAQFNNVKVVDSVSDTFEFKLFMCGRTAVQFNDIKVVDGVNGTFAFERSLVETYF